MTPYRRISQRELAIRGLTRNTFLGGYFNIFADVRCPGRLKFTVRAIVVLL